MWDPPRPGLEPVSPALAGGFSTTAPPGKPLLDFYFYFFWQNPSYISRVRPNDSFSLLQVFPEHSNGLISPSFSILFFSILLPHQPKYIYFIYIYIYIVVISIISYNIHYIFFFKAKEHVFFIFNTYSTWCILGARNIIG